jgi:hypothetical protein
MSEPLEIAKLYFELSNESDFAGIEKLFTDYTTYNSQTTGTYRGADDIMVMQRQFHGKFSSLNWKVNLIREVKPDVILFDYEFSGMTKDDQEIKSSGLEYITVQNDKIQNIEIRTKTSK